MWDLDPLLEESSVCYIWKYIKIKTKFKMSITLNKEQQFF